MRFEPLYGLPVEEPGDIEGWSINADQPGPLLAVAIATELARIEADYNALAATLAGLPMHIQVGRIALPRAVWREALPFQYQRYNTAPWRGSQADTFERPFDEPPVVVLLPQLVTFPGDIVEVTASNITQSGFTGNMLAENPPATQYTSGWIAVERTQT